MKRNITPAAPKLRELERSIDSLWRGHLRCLNRCFQDALKLGDLLRQAKDIVGHGRWNTWLRQRGIKARNATRYMRASVSPRRAEVEQAIAQGKSATLADLIDAPNSPIAFPSVADGKYALILADPPWRYRNAGRAGAAEAQYRTMEIEEICGAPVEEIASDRAVLALWTTISHNRVAFDVIDRWGFEYRSQIVWVKTTATGRPRRGGLGYYVMAAHELLLIATRGGPWPPEVRPPSVLEAPARGHSRKPDQQYGLVESMYPSIPRNKRIELFARHPWDGWDSWGAEAPAVAAGGER